MGGCAYQVCLHTAWPREAGQKDQPYLQAPRVLQTRGPCSCFKAVSISVHSSYILLTKDLLFTAPWDLPISQSFLQPSGSCRGSREQNLSQGSASNFLCFLLGVAEGTKPWGLIFSCSGTPSSATQGFLPCCMGHEESTGNDAKKTMTVCCMKSHQEDTFPPISHSSSELLVQQQDTFCPESKG